MLRARLRARTSGELVRPTRYWPIVLAAMSLAEAAHAPLMIAAAAPTGTAAVGSLVVSATSAVASAVRRALPYVASALRPVASPAALATPETVSSAWVASTGAAPAADEPWANPTPVQPISLLSDGSGNVVAPSAFPRGAMVDLPVPAAHTTGFAGLDAEPTGPATAPVLTQAPTFPTAAVPTAAVTSPEVLQPHPLTAVPEPATTTLLAAGFCLLAPRRRAHR